MSSLFFKSFIAQDSCNFARWRIVLGRAKPENTSLINLPASRPLRRFR